MGREKASLRTMGDIVPICDRENQDFDAGSGYDGNERY
jgi:hypothetical protein